MSDAFKISDSARTRPNPMQLVEKQKNDILVATESCSDYKISPILVQSVPDVQEIGEGYWTNDCFVEVLKSNDQNEPENPKANSPTDYSVINVDPNITFCNEHLDLYLHTDETLLQPGDKFDSHESFRMYIDRNAERWLHYYACSDSSLQGRYKTEQYTYTCVYGNTRDKDQRYQTKGIRKRAQSLKTNCPCKIVLKRLPYNNNLLTVIFVCHHHNHELSKEAFMKLQHGRRLSPEVREEMLDLLYLEVEPAIVRDYIHSITKLNLNYSFFVNNARAMKKKNLEREFTAEKLAMLTQKIEDIKRTFGRGKQVKQGAKQRKPRKKQNNDSNVVELQGSEVNESYDSSTDGRGKRSSDVTEQYGENKKSRLETCLQILSCDEETLQSVKRLQNSVQCETFSSDKENIIEMPSGVSTLNQFGETYTSEIQEDEIATTIVDDNSSHIEVQDSGMIELHEITAEELSQLPETYVVENGGIQTLYIDGQEYACQVIYQNDGTGTTQEQEVYSNEVYQISNETNIDENQELSNIEEKDSSHITITKQDADVTTDVSNNITGVSSHDTTYENNHETTHASNLDDTTHESNHGIIQASNHDTTRGSYHDTTYENKHDTIHASNRNATCVNDQETYPAPEYEYIHRYNIDQYMTQTWFPKYIEKVAESTRVSIVDMLKNIYLGKGMFRLLATNKMEVKTIRIMYLNENLPILDTSDTTEKNIRERKADGIKFCKRYMTLKKKAAESSKYIRCLYEAVSILTKENDELKFRNYSQIKKSKFIDENNEVKKLRETKESLKAEISEAHNEIRQLKAIKNDLKKGICRFISKSILLRQASGEDSDSLNEVKRTLNKVINKSSLKSSAHATGSCYIIKQEDEEKL